MASEYSTASQQPFASPQPTAMTQAASPPTKQSLKKWWQGFRPPAKSQESHGNSSLSWSAGIRHLSPRKRIPIINTLRSNSKTSCFRESSMSNAAPVVDGQPVDGPTQVLKVRKRSQARISFKVSDYSSHEGNSFNVLSSKRQSSSNLTRNNQSSPLMQSKRSKSLMFARSRLSSMKLDRSKGSIWLPLSADSHSDSSDAQVRSGRQHNQVLNPLSRLAKKFKCPSFGSSSSEENAKRRIKIVEQPTGIFGVPLRQSITYANVAISLVDGEGKSYIYGYVPIVVAKCGVYLKEKATNVEGIFRLSGSEKRIKELKTVFDSPDRYGKGLDWAGYTVHDAANVLRRYLNQLPEPIVPLDLYERFREPLRGHTMQAVGDTEGPQLPDSFDVGKAIVTYQQLITELPPLNRQLLLYILDLLAVFASKSDENRMNSQNLAAIFQPGMLSHPAHDMAPVEYRLSQDVIIFLIENQDHFLIGMRGTAADEQTVQDVQNGTPPPGTPRTPGHSKNMVGRSASNASAGADSVRKYGGIRRNVSTSSRHSRQSNGAPSPASPAFGVTLTQSSSGGVHRSNTVPSKRSPGLPSNRLQKHSGSPSPTGAVVAGGFPIVHRGLPTGAETANTRDGPVSAGLAPTAERSLSLSPSFHPASTVTSQDRLLVDEKQSEVTTPTKERTVSSLFKRSPTAESDGKAPNKLRKKRIPSSSNPSAQSSTHSLPGQVASPGLNPFLAPGEIAEHPGSEAMLSHNPPSRYSSTQDSTDPLHNTSESVRPEQPHHSSDNTLKPRKSPTSSIHSKSSINDLSDADHVDDAAERSEQRDKRSRWRLSRRREDSQSHSNTLSPSKALGSDTGAGASSSTVGSSSRPRKSFTGDTVSSDPSLIAAIAQSSNESGAGAADDKKGPLGWIKNKMREKREESRDKEAEKERAKSPGGQAERGGSLIPGRGKSVDLARGELEKRGDENAGDNGQQQQQR